MKPRPMKIFQYPKCSTCRKALRWLSEHQVAADARDLVADRLSERELTDLWKRSGLPIAKFFNTSGVSYRQGGFGVKLKTMSDAQAVKALAADGKLVIRPILDDGKHVVVGFNEDAYKKAVHAA